MVLHQPADWRILSARQVYRAYLMQRPRAKAIAIAQQQVLRTRLAIAAGLLLLPALLLLLISP